MRSLTQSLEAVAKAGSDVKKQTSSVTFSLGTDGRTIPQRTADEGLKLAIDALNQNVNGRHLFGGRVTDSAPVESYDRIMNGDATHIGLKQYIADRVTLEAGPLNDGRLGVSGAGTAVTLTRSDATAYGLTLNAITSHTAGVTVTAPGGSPASGGVSFTGAVAEGTTVNVVLGLPDGTTQTLQLTATTTTPLKANQFLADADPNVAAASLRAQLGAAVTLEAAKLPSASAIAAAKAFFAGTDATPAPASASGNPIVWYHGEDAGGGSIRPSAPVQVDAGQTVGLGVAANEGPIRDLLAGLGAFANASFADTAADRARYDALAEKVSVQLSPPTTAPKVSDIVTEIGGALTAMAGAKDRHDASRSILQDTVDEVENAKPEEVASAILALQTKLQASYQTTAMISRLSLVNYL
jgi:flagellin-like hook-associated protein FlgL